MGNVVYGVDADLERNIAHRSEHIRRLGEVANIMLDAGMILIATAADLTQEEFQLIKTSADSDRTVTTWIGDQSTTDVDADLFLDAADDPAESAERLYQLLLRVGTLGRA